MLESRSQFLQCCSQNEQVFVEDLHWGDMGKRVYMSTKSRFALGAVWDSSLTRPSIDIGEHKPFSPTNLIKKRRYKSTKYLCMHDEIPIMRPEVPPVVSLVRCLAGSVGLGGNEMHSTQGRKGLTCLFRRAATVGRIVQGSEHSLLIYRLTGLPDGEENTDGVSFSFFKQSLRKTQDMAHRQCSKTSEEESIPTQCK